MEDYQARKKREEYKIGFIDKIKNLFLPHCPYCKSRDLYLIGYQNTYYPTDYWWENEKTNCLGMFKHRIMECKKCHFSHIVPR